MYWNAVCQLRRAFGLGVCAFMGRPYTHTSDRNAFSNWPFVWPTRATPIGSAVVPVTLPILTQ